MGFMDSVKGFAEKVGGTVEKGVNSVSESTKKMQEKAKLKKEIAQLEAEINSAYIEIGKRHFDEISENPSEENANDVEIIKSRNIRVEQLRNLLGSLEDKMPCANCGAELLKTDKFCAKCGAKVVVPVSPVFESSEERAETVKAERVCPTCQNVITDDSAFCEKCGTQL